MPTGASPAHRGCRKLGLKGDGNAEDKHHDERNGLSQNPRQCQEEVKWKIQSLWIYPIKSCKGIELDKAAVVSTGMQYDRQFSFAQLKAITKGVSSLENGGPEHAWEFVTQRTFPRLACIQSELWVPDPISPGYSYDSPETRSGGILIVKYPYSRNIWYNALSAVRRALGFSSITRSFNIPLNPTPEQISEKHYTIEKMSIWKDSLLALNIGASIVQNLQNLQEYLGASNKLTLFQVAPRRPREVYRCAPKASQIGYQPVVGFADAYPLHILNLASVQDVGSRLGEHTHTLSPSRFRANIIIKGGPAYAEDSWKKIRIGAYEFYVCCRTVRCKLPNTDQNTGIKHATEPDQALRSFRCIDEGARKMACLGMQMVPAAEKSEVKLSDNLEVLDVGEHYYIRQ